MTDYRKVELIDHIRNDALLLMKNRNISYEEAFDLCRKNLINDEKITEYTAAPLEVDIGEIIKTKVSQDTGEKSLDQIIYNTLKDVINISDYTTEQLEEYYIAVKMDVDITKFARKEWNPMQVKFLAIMVASDLDIEKYLDDPNFDAEKAFMEKYNDSVNNVKKIGTMPN